MLTSQPMNLILLIITLLIVTQIALIILSQRRRRQQQANHLQKLWHDFALFHPEITATAVGLYGHITNPYTNQPHNLHITLPDSHDPPLMHIQLQATLPSHLRLTLRPNIGLNLDPLAHQHALTHRFHLYAQPEELVDDLLHANPLLPHKIEAALEPLFAIEPHTDCHLTLNGEANQLILQHRHLRLSVTQLETAVRLLLTLAHILQLPPRS